MDYKEAKRLLHPYTTREAICEIEDKQEAINKINEACFVACEAMDELQEYKQIGTLDEVREAMEKQRIVQPDAAKKQTNADWIRNMTDEDLADVFSSFLESLDTCYLCPIDKYNLPCRDCKTGILKWLQLELK